MSFDFKLYGNLTRRFFEIWNTRSETGSQLTQHALPFALYDMEIFPSKSQVHEMLHCASECSKRKNANYLTFGEFCVFASELKTCYDKKVQRPTPLSRCRKESRRSHARLKMMTSRVPATTKYQGGSCNPTTWRQDTAIPFLKKHGITYYNPQVAHWVPELIELENQAKQNAEVMFFVIDNQTRSIASMIEAAHIAGTQRKLILNIHEFKGPGSLVMDEPITQKEFEDLQQGHRYLQDLVERQNIPVFHNIPESLNCTGRVVHEKIRPQDLTLDDTSHPVKMAHVQLGEKLIKLKEVFDGLDTHNSGEIMLEDVCMAFKILTSHELTFKNLKAIIEGQNGVVEFPVNVDDVRITFDQFCCIMTEFTTPQGNGTVLLSNVVTKLLQALTSVVAPFSRIIDWVIHHPNDNCNIESQVQFACEYRDIYLGGSGKPSVWREETAIPLLKKKGLTFYCPQDGPWSNHFIPLEAAVIEKCQVLLFVITCDTRSLSEMILAAHYVGQDCNVVLCIQHLNNDVCIQDEKLSEQAVKDYNRGRVYLSDLANRAGMPVFDNIAEAVECAANKSVTACD